MFTFTKVVCLLAYASFMNFMTVGGAPLTERTLDKRIVYDPPITNPDAGSVWKVGETKTVTWDTSVLPEESHAQNPQGKLILGYLEGDDINEHLMLDTPLAEGFALWDGQATVTVPSVPYREGYIVVLMGSSGNASPKFTIKGGVTVGSNAVTSALTSIISTPIPITGSEITGGSSTATATSATVTATAPSSSVIGTSASSASQGSSAGSSSSGNVSSVASSAISSAASAASSAASAAAASASTPAPNAGVKHGPTLLHTTCLGLLSVLLVISM